MFASEPEGDEIGCEHDHRCDAPGDRRDGNCQAGGDRGRDPADTRFPAPHVGPRRELTRRAQQRDTGYGTAELFATRVQGGGRPQCDRDGCDDEHGIAGRGEQPDCQRAHQRGEEERGRARRERDGGRRQREDGTPEGCDAVPRPTGDVAGRHRPGRGTQRVTETRIVEDLPPQPVRLEPVVGPLVDAGDALRDERRHVAACVEAEAREVDVELPRAGLVAPLEANGTAALLAVGQRRGDQVDARGR